MIRYHAFLAFLAKTSVALLVLGALWRMGDGMAAAPPSNSAADNPPAPAKTPQAEVEVLAGQIKELQKQLSALQTQVKEMASPRIIAAGTATLELGKVQNNATYVRVKMKAEVTERLGNDYVVLLTTRVPTGSVPLYVPYWKKAKDGFDITLASVTLAAGGTESYLFKTDTSFPIDWIVVKK
jgi:hypothetical protein